MFHSLRNNIVENYYVADTNFTSKNNNGTTSAKRHALGIQTLEEIITERSTRERDSAAGTVEDRIYDALLAVVESIGVPRSESAVELRHQN